jgi:hypothetical protein
MISLGRHPPSTSAIDSAVGIDSAA